MVKGSFENRGIIYNIRSGYSETLKSCKEGIDLLDIYELIKIEEHTKNKNNGLLESMAIALDLLQHGGGFHTFIPYML